MMSLPTAEEREGEEEEGEFVLTKEGKDFSFFFFKFPLSSFVFGTLFFGLFRPNYNKFPHSHQSLLSLSYFTFIEIARFRNAPRSLVTRANTRNTHSCLEALAEDTIAT